MTEAEWLADTDPMPMLEFVRGKASDRKVRLFAVGCCQQLMPWNQNERVSEALIRAERYAEGELADATMEKWCQELNRISFRIRQSMGGGGSAQTVICNAVNCACLPKRYMGVIHTWEALVNLGGVFGSDFPDRGRTIVHALMNDLFGNPFRPVAVEPAWLTSTVVALAEGIYQDRAFDRLPILGDALMDAGCDNSDVLNHCRSDGPHVRGCWVVDLLTGRK
jgi:hypothetical protein